jgi:hypothetical protein
MSKELNFRDKILLWWKWEGKFMLRNFKQGCKNIYYWFPVIWKDRNWDDSYIFTILSHKLKSQAKYISSRGIHVSAERDAEVIMTCVRLIKLVQDEYYSTEWMDYHKTKYWFEPIEDQPGYSSWESEQMEENFDDYFKKYPLIYKRVLNGEGIFNRAGREDNKEIIAMNIAHINHDRARKLLFKTLESNIEKWWD